ASGRATVRRRCGRHSGCAPASSGPTPSTASTPPPPSAATGSPASAAKVAGSAWRPTSRPEPELDGSSRRSHRSRDRFGAPSPAHSVRHMDRDEGKEPTMTDASIRLVVIIGSTRGGRFGPTVADWFVGEARQHADLDVDVLDLVDAALPDRLEPFGTPTP